MTKSNWDYRGIAAECYDLWFGDEPFWDQAFFEDRIRHNGGAALEIACGTGRLLSEVVVSCVSCGRGPLTHHYFPASTSRTTPVGNSGELVGRG